MGSRHPQRPPCGAMADIETMVLGSEDEQTDAAGAAKGAEAKKQTKTVAKKQTVKATKQQTRKATKQQTGKATAPTTVLASISMCYVCDLYATIVS